MLVKFLNKVPLMIAAVSSEPFILILYSKTGSKEAFKMQRVPPLSHLLEEKSFLRDNPIRQL